MSFYDPITYRNEKWFQNKSFFFIPKRKMSFNLLQFCPISLNKLRFRTNWKGNGVNSKKI